MPMSPLDGEPSCFMKHHRLMANAGLIEQVTVFLTQERYNYATVFMDHFSD